MYKNISLCDFNEIDKRFNLILSESSFIELWNYLNLSIDQNEFNYKDIIDAIDKKLDPDYTADTNSSDLLDTIKSLEDICIKGLVERKNICVRDIE